MADASRTSIVANLSSTVALQNLVRALAKAYPSVYGVSRPLFVYSPTQQPSPMPSEIGTAPTFAPTTVTVLSVAQVQ